jgi:glycosyltransferase involved in cell wall biosynthesis
MLNAGVRPDLNGKKKILLFADWYEPGYKAGGPIRSCVNFAAYMRDDYQLYVFTSDRDLGSSQPYEQIKTDEWLSTAGGIQVFYCSPERLGWKNIRRQLSAIQPDFVYLNSMFSTKFTIYPLLMGRTGRMNYRTILSPRGMLRSSALQFKPAKKKIFLKGFRWLGFHKKVAFVAADDTEVADIKRYFGGDARVAKIPNFPAPLSGSSGAAGTNTTTLIKKDKGDLSLIYIGRIHPIKGLDYLLKVLQEVRATIRLTIVGSVEDEAFWMNCRQLIRNLPANIVVTHAGEIPNDQLPRLTIQQHIFALPTKGENFGHAIFEALALGKPVLISDQTPWRGLQAAGAGWDLPLDKPDEFRLAIEEAAALGQSAYEAICRTSRKYLEDYINRLDLKEDYKKLFS